MVPRKEGVGRRSHADFLKLVHGQDEYCGAVVRVHEGEKLSHGYVYHRHKRISEAEAIVAMLNGELIA
jgi:hypothetical protein